MPYYLETDDREELKKLLKYQVCTECGSKLEAFYDLEKHLPYLQCKANPNHEGIEREASRYEQEGLAALNIPTRREIMEQEYGEGKTKALDKYLGVVSLTKPQALEILKAVYPDAPDDEITRAVMLCASYGLNPLMKHVFLIKFNKWNKDHTKIIGEEWATVIGIKAKRLLASRPGPAQRGPYSYVDNTPRVMTEQEQKAIFGEVETDKLWVITKVKDPQTGAEAVGYGFWPKAEKPYGSEKGNSKFNMAAIRSESQALDRLRPGEMPVGIEVAPEEFIEGEYTVRGPSKGDEKIGELAGEIRVGRGLGAAILSSPKQEVESTKNVAPPAKLEGEGFHIDLQWLDECLKGLNWCVSTAKTFVGNRYKVSPIGTLGEVLQRLTREQAEDFVNEMNILLENQRRVIPRK